MSTITVIFTKRQWNPVSWLIRWAVPRSRFALALSSHCLIVDGDHVIEANMIHGVRRVPTEVGMAGLTVVKTVDYSVQDAEAGLVWGRLRDGEKYDYPGAFGIAIRVDRDWAEPGRWFCYELAAAVLKAAGRDAFAYAGYITETTLLSIKP